MTAIRRFPDTCMFLYIHRHPAETLNSYRKIVWTWPWGMACHVQGGVRLVPPAQ